MQRSAITPSAKDPYGAYFEPIVRVHGGVPVNRVVAEIAHAHAKFVAHGQTRVHLERKHDLMVHDVQPALFALEIAVGVVWLIACCNVAGLLLARVAARRTEIAVRSALGAGRRRIVAQFLTESLLLSAAGAMGGLALAAAMLRTFQHMLGKTLPMGQDIHFNWVVFLSLLVLTLLTALAFGMFPALLAAWAGTRAGFGRKQAGDRGQNRARAVLLVGEVALSDWTAERCWADDADDVRAAARAAGVPDRSPSDDEFDRLVERIYGPEYRHAGVASCAGCSAADAGSGECRNVNGDAARASGGVADDCVQDRLDAGG